MKLLSFCVLTLTCDVNAFVVGVGVYLFVDNNGMLSMIKSRSLLTMCSLHMEKVEALAACP